VPRAADFKTTAQTDLEVIAANADRAIRPRAIHLSVPSGQHAQLKYGSAVIASTHGNLNLDEAAVREGFESGKNQAMTLDSSGGVSVTIVYDLVKR
jgi:hypothetical protein